MVLVRRSVSCIRCYRLRDNLYTRRPMFSFSYAFCITLYTILFVLLFYMSEISSFLSSSAIFQSTLDNSTAVCVLCSQCIISLCTAGNYF